MTVRELNRDQLQQLKLNYYTHGGVVDISYEDAADIDNIISDEEIYAEYAGIVFVPDDFFGYSDDDEYVHFAINTNGYRNDISDMLRYIADAVENGVYGGVYHGIEWDCDKLY